MGLPNKDELKGKLRKGKGEIKETTGRVLDDRELEDEGRADRAAGEVRDQYGKAKRKVGEKIEEIGKAVRK